MSEQHIHGSNHAKCSFIDNMSALFSLVGAIIKYDTHCNRPERWPSKGLNEWERLWNMKLCLFWGHAWRPKRRHVAHKNSKSRSVFDSLLKCSVASERKAFASHSNSVHHFLVSTQLEHAVRDALCRGIIGTLEKQHRSQCTMAFKWIQWRWWWWVGLFYFIHSYKWFWMMIVRVCTNLKREKTRTWANEKSSARSRCFT